MAVPKKKTSKSRTKRRYSKWASDQKKKLINKVLPRIGKLNKKEDAVKVIKVDDDEKKPKAKKEVKPVEKKETKKKEVKKAEKPKKEKKEPKAKKAEDNK